MFTTKHQIVRYNKLDKCFQNFWKEYTINDLLEAECEELIHFLYAELINFLYRDKYIYDSEFVNSHIDFDNDNLSVDIYTHASLYKNGLNDLNETNWNF